MKSILTVLFAFVTFGCGESAFEPANLDAEGKTAAGPVEDRERKERAAAEVQASLDRLSETSAEIDRVLRSSTLDSLGERSTYEATVSDAIQMLEEHQELDPQIRKLMTDNQIWYDTYRDSESMNQSSDRDDQRMPIHKKTVSTYDSHDEQLGAVHALADFVEQYRVTKDHRLTKIQNRATSQESPSDEYKKKYKEVSAIAFDTATSYSRRDDVSLYLGDLSREELEEAKKKFPLFPKGSRFKANEEQRKEDERLFGKENK